MKPITVQEVAYHRNGVCGVGFYVIRFKWANDGERKQRNMVATYFDHDAPPATDCLGEFQNPRCAVLDIDETAKGNIAFARGNSWRGDNFAPELHAAIKRYEAERNLELGIAP